MTSPAPDALFAGLRVIDVASYIAAPTAAMILGDLGSDVIKIEPVGDGDPYRAIHDTPALPQSGTDHCWITDSRSKRSLTLNLKADEGRAIMLKLVAGCDVFITNQPFPVRGRLRLGYEHLSPLNPRMIFASLTAYGEQGPERDRGAFDGVAYWGRSGLEDLIRSRGSVPAPSAPGQGDHPTGVTLYAAIVTALYRRQLTGQGSHVHTSLLANGFWSNACLGAAALAGADFEEWRSRPADRPGTFTRNVYEASDGRFLQFLMARSDEEHENALRVAGLGKMLDDERFADADSRWDNVLPIIEAMTKAIGRRPATDWIESFEAAGVPCSLVRYTHEMGDDEQAKINDVLIAPQTDDVGVPWIINHPVRVEGIAEAGAIRPPAVGEHTDEILDELGYETEAIDALRRDGVV
ncbi:MAG: CaiB/BaiF CoA-transferase family protein [Acidobacteriota bacterium]|nr:CaiB/BaiF CoA-transferase family protein [Acidobacteriota bacterium]